MGGGHIGSALRRLRGLLGAECAGGPTDGELLRRYVHAHDELAFDTLLRRHGPMVLGVCRRLLPNGHDVDDAFQATFLVLLRRARSISDGERVGNWLYGVAYRVALRARDQAARRRARQRLLSDMPVEDARDPSAEQEVRALLDEEVMRLPDRYREAVVCCYLQGRTQEEAARVLGWPKGTVATRLNRARELLRRRLVRRGLTLSAGALILTLTPPPAAGAVPPGLLAATVRLGGASHGGAAVPAGVAALADMALRPLALTYLKTAVAGALVALTVVGGGTFAGRLGPSAGASREDGPVSEARAQAVPAARGAAALPVNRQAVTVVAVAISRAGQTPSAADVYSPGRTGQPDPCGEASGFRGRFGQVITLTITLDGNPAASVSRAEALYPCRHDRDQDDEAEPSGAEARASHEPAGQVVCVTILASRRAASAGRNGCDGARQKAMKVLDATNGACRVHISGRARATAAGAWACDEWAAVALARRAAPGPYGRCDVAPGVWVWSATDG
jgi:RNA polymerase sigma factor (sigma-70 family)